MTINYDNVPRGRFQRDQYNGFKTANIYTLVNIKVTHKAKQHTHMYNPAPHHYLRKINVTSALHPSGVAKSSTSFGWGRGGNVTSAGWQVTLCAPIWHVSSRSGDGRLACKLLYPSLLYFIKYQYATELTMCSRCNEMMMVQYCHRCYKDRASSKFNTENK